MIYITGDCHTDYRRFNREIFPEQKGMTKEDYVIVCGDFGLWDTSKEMKYWLDWLEKKSFTTLWVDGNHENFDLLREYPMELWHGGKVQRIRPSVIHLMRGQVFAINGLTIFAFGGARSHDMDGGVLVRDAADFKLRKKLLDQRKISYRILGETWWPQEMPDEEEMEEGRRNLEKCGWKVDYIVTHCCADSVLKALRAEGYQSDELSVYFEELRGRCDFRKWFFGHYHDNRNVTDRDLLLYEQIIRIQ